MPQKVQQLHTIFSLSYHLYVFTGLQGSLYTSAEQSMVISNGNFNYGVGFGVFHNWIIKISFNKSINSMMLGEKNLQHIL
jgi:hypothetical protein